MYMCECVCVCVVCEECEIMWIFFFLIFRLTCIFVGLTDFVKRGVLTLVDEISRYRNHNYYYYIRSRCGGYCFSVECTYSVTISQFSTWFAVRGSHVQCYDWPI